MSTRLRLRIVLFAAVGVMSTGYIAAVTVSTLAARAITGSAFLAGVPATAGTVATAAGTAWLGRLVVRAGRRRALLVGAATAAAGSVAAFAAVRVASFSLLAISMAVIGFGWAAAHLARYTAAELVEPARRGSAVSIVVWASTIGAVAGPRLLDPSGRVAEGMGVAPYAGGYLANAVFMAIGAALFMVALRPDPSTLAIVDRSTDRAGSTVGSAFALPAVRLALAAMVVGQFVMVLIMTATPIHIEDNGFGLATVGGVISAHTLGMFAFAPLVGRLTDRVGPVAAMWLGAAVLFTSGAVAAAAPSHATTVLGWGLFLLGLGWNLGFVAGSTLLTVSVPPHIRPVVQGRVDSMVWGVGAVATLSSGMLLEGPGYAFTAVLGSVLVSFLLVALLLGRRVVPART